MLHLISYDIASDKRRAKVAKVLEAFGDRVQQSVFECDLSAAQLARLRERLARHLLNTEDSVRIYPLCGGCVGRLQVMGTGARPAHDSVVCV
jgi:CRISPR-associated protein Cas2